MACSRFEYVKSFEIRDVCLPNCYIVVRIDGNSFHRYSQEHGFSKPNDKEALNLMNAAAEAVLNNIDDIWIAYGTSDEYSFIIDRNSQQFSRRSSKYLSLIVSLFTSNYIFLWSKYMSVAMKYPPCFDGRIVLYPSKENIRDYLSWRQADCHINNLYNTAFWALVDRGNLSREQAECKLNKSVSEGKRNEILFSMFGINYNEEPEQFRKGTVKVREFQSDQDRQNYKRNTNRINQQNLKIMKRAKGSTSIHSYNCDIIKDNFWEERPWLLA